MIRLITILMITLCAGPSWTGAKPSIDDLLPMRRGDEVIDRAEARRLLGVDTVDSAAARYMLAGYLSRLDAARRGGYAARVDSGLPDAVRRDLMVAFISADSVESRITQEAMEECFRACRDSFAWSEPHAKCRLFIAADTAGLERAVAIVDSVESAPDRGGMKLSAPEITSLMLREGVRGVRALDVVAARGVNPYVDHLVFCSGPPSPTAEAGAWEVSDVRLLDAPESVSDVADAVAAFLRDKLLREWIDRLCP